MRSGKFRVKAFAAVAVALGIALGAVPAFGAPGDGEVSVGSGAGEAGQSARPSYDEVYQIVDQVDSYSNNGREYGSSYLKFAFDGDPNTHWETGSKNDADFKNYVDVVFKQTTEIGRLVYYPRVLGDRGKGYPTELSVYASESEQGEDFELVHHSSQQADTGALTIDFDQAYSFKLLRFQFDAAHKDWAAMAELKFYKYDQLNHDVHALFTNGTFTKLASGVTSNQVEALYQQSLTHPDAGLTALLESARELLAGVDLEADVIELSRTGDPRSYSANVLKMSSFGSALLPTGIAARSGETLRVYVEADPKAPLPRLVTSQSVGIYSNWKASHQLHVGENVITVPSFDNVAGTVAGGPLYFENPYTPSEQPVAPKVRIVGGYDFPFFKDGDNVADFLKELRDYTALRTENPDQYGDIVEIANDFVTASGVLANAQDYLDGSSDPQKALDFAKDRVQKLLALSGVTGFYGVTNAKGVANPVAEFKPASPTEMPIPRHMIRLVRMPSAGYFAYASGDHTGVGEGTMTSIFKGGYYGWAIPHELGHHFDSPKATWVERSNNMWAGYNQVVLQGEADRISDAEYEEIFTKLAPDNYADLFGSEERYNIEFAMLWQLYLYDHDFWKEYQLAARAGDFAGLDEPQRMVALASEALGFDASDHFDRYRYFERRYPNLSAEERQAVKDTVAEQIKKAGIPVRPDNARTWYMWTKAADDVKAAAAAAGTGPVGEPAAAGRTFADLAPVQIDSVRYGTGTGEDGNGTVTVQLSDPLVRDAARLGYEVSMDGKVLAFTRSNALKVALPAGTNTDASHRFTVRAFDLELNPTRESSGFTASAADPQIAVVGATVVPVGADADAVQAMVQAYSAAGEPLKAIADTSGVKFDTPGTYPVRFTAKDSAGHTVTRTVTVNIAAEVKSLSKDGDAGIMPAESKVAWPENSGPSYNKKIQSQRKISLPVHDVLTGEDRAPDHEYEQGIVAHANSRLVYDLSELKPQYFEAFVGIDGAVDRDKAPSSVTMKVIADGRTIYTSGVIGAATPAQQVKLDITGVKQLELVADANGSNSSDHAAWADAKISLLPADPEQPGGSEGSGEPEEQEQPLEQGEPSENEPAVVSNAVATPVASTANVARTPDTGAHTAMAGLLALALAALGGLLVAGRKRA